MKKFLVLLLALIMLFAVACGSDTPYTEPVETDPVITEPSETTALCNHTQTVQITQTNILTDGFKKVECKNCHTILSQSVIPATKSIKILAIGNSFSTDATTYLYDLFVAAGVENVTVGNAFVSGCSIEKHYQLSQSGESAYSYYKYTREGDTKVSASLEQMVSDEDWDIITLQQASQYSGMPETYTDLDALIDFVLDTCTNPRVDLKFHMTWAYEQSTNHGGFKNYGNDQMTMYNAIVNAVKTTALAKEEISGVLPAGTAIQNLRTSYFGDTLTRDGYHLSLDAGRYTAALTWVCAITGASAYDVKWVPSEYGNLDDDLAAIREAVSNAIETPFEVTDSTILVKVEKNVQDKFADAGLDMNDYVLIDWEPKLLYSWNASKSTKPGKSASMPQFTASKMFTKAELPIGTVIVVDKGYKYRPDGWVVNTAPYTGTRPSTCSTLFTIVDEAWWGEFNYRAFNISKLTGSEPATEEDIKHFKIYVHKDSISTETPPTETVTAKTDAELFATAGLDISNYDAIDWSPRLLYCWNASKSINPGKSASMPQFTASKKFEKSELPTGTVIIIDDGYQYRPDGWVNKDEVFTGDRPKATSVNFTVIDEAWWGDFNYRGFNISLIGSSEPATDEDTKHFKIYVPKTQGE